MRLNRGFSKVGKESSPVEPDMNTDFFGGGENSPARIRVKEAVETGASILAIACPVCATILHEAAKGEGLEDSITVKDISDLINSNTKPEG